MPELLDPQQREDALAGLTDWSIVGDALMREFVFTNFKEAFAFMTQVAIQAEQLGHHPDWSNSYNTVTISLSTHDAGGITDSDVALARAISIIYGSTH